jgi:hypothetical protein
MNTQDLEAKVAAGEITKLHTSYIRRYVSRKSGSYVVPYNGKFGKGFAVLSPNWGSTRYSHITYYVSLTANDHDSATRDRNREPHTSGIHP